MKIQDFIRNNPNIFVHIVCCIISIFAFIALLVDANICKGLIESDKANGWNKILATLGGSFIAGYLFYIITTTVINWVVKQKEKELKKKQNVFIIITFKKLNDEFKNLIKPIVNSLREHYNKKWYNNIPCSVKINLIDNLIPHITKEIDTIFVFQQYLSDKQLNILRKIKEINFFEVADMLMKNPCSEEYLKCLETQCENLLNLTSELLISINEEKQNK